MTEEQEREAFEAWHTKMVDDESVNHLFVGEPKAAWLAWQARASLPSNPEHDTYGAPVAWMYRGAAPMATFVTLDQLSADYIADTGYEETPLYTYGAPPVGALTDAERLDALRWGSNVAETLLSIGRAIGFGRAQQILGEQWDAEHGCAPRGRMGVTVKPEDDWGASPEPDPKPTMEEADYRRGYRDGYNRRDDEVKGALA